MTPFRWFLVYAVTILACGCDPKPMPPTTPLVVSPTLESSRFQVEILSTFEDRLAYGSERGVYLLRDTTTGQEFVGISGVGISAVGWHRVDKNNGVRDER